MVHPGDPTTILPFCPSASVCVCMGGEQNPLQAWKLWLSLFLELGELGWKVHLFFLSEDVFIY